MGPIGLDLPAPLLLDSAVPVWPLPSGEKERGEILA